MVMLRARLVASGIRNNEIFQTDSPHNRDGTFAPYVHLRDVFQAYGIEINTADVTGADEAAFELHQDVQCFNDRVPAYLLMFETPMIKPRNGNAGNFTHYRKIFTWNDDLVDGQRFIKLNFPNPIQIHPVDGFVGRDRFCCLIAGNKSLAVRDSRDLYVERIRAIRWFERHTPQDFDLYGVDWDIPAWGRGLIGKVSRRLCRAIAPMVEFHSFPSYRGRVGHKRDVLAHTRFAICYENVRDLPGYITEKIFDCFFSGCVPVYWGANNVTDHIPADCFIDRRTFSDDAAVYEFLKNITEDEYRAYQQHIADFLRSDAAYPFSSEAFAETVVPAIVQDLGYKA